MLGGIPTNGRYTDHAGNTEYGYPTINKDIRLSVDVFDGIVLCIKWKNITISADFSFLILCNGNNIIKIVISANL